MALKTALLGTVVAAAASAAFGGAATAASINGWYIGLEGGAAWIEDWEHALFTPALTASASYDTGWAVLATVGHAWGSGWRLEFEGGYRANDLDQYTFLGTPVTFVGGDLWEVTLMANVLYDIHVTDRLSISLGAGAGGDFANQTFTVGPFTFEDDDWNFAYQGIGGLNYMIGQQTALVLNYRYTRVHEPDFFAPFLINQEDLVKHTATIGLRYALQAPAAYIEPDQPPPAPGPMAPPPRQFIVFFGFNKYNLTSEAMRVIAEAVVAAKETGSATVLISGHTDTVGSHRYNERLSMRRANVVKAEMVRQGVSPAAITSIGKGETELLVQTADGVKEPQNRRSTIDLN